ncbi:hypothetical protein [Thiocystis violascens]|uniref:Uncharacterized protein n=1 Tax=Thiocystis violascens (strain ATCC 17096 / DSM 198 / 6111) TaxID=765911 RepID=I3YGT4_THIV6|nr:hypothetical protein [Thiocystis violascens]AFL76202.1 hypothetical protein Thivi_4399 [Thiocystis violascens DSM 198]
MIDDAQVDLYAHAKPFGAASFDSASFDSASFDSAQDKPFGAAYRHPGDARTPNLLGLRDAYLSAVECRRAHVLSLCDRLNALANDAGPSLQEALEAEQDCLDDLLEATLARFEYLTNRPGGA